jgi:hypothetical protein
MNKTGWTADSLFLELRKDRKGSKGTKAQGDKDEGTPQDA